MNRKYAARRRFLTAAAAALAGAGFIRKPVRAAEFVYKYGHDAAIESPQHVRAVQMAEDIKRDTNGRLEIQVFPNSILGGDPAMIAQVREGALQFSSQSGILFTAFTPLAGIQSVPYAFRTLKDAIAASYGELGNAIRREVSLKTGFHMFPGIIDTGFRQITSSTHPIRTADDLVGFKIRTPPGSIIFDVYKALGADVAVTPVNELYTALQTHLVDGEENGYVIIETQRFFEVQKYLSVLNSMWSGQALYCNGDAWKALPPDLQQAFERNAALFQRRQQQDSAALAISLMDKLRRQGLIFNIADGASFKARLAPWYAKAKQTYGATMWGLLEKYSGKLG